MQEPSHYFPLCSYRGFLIYCLFVCFFLFFPLHSYSRVTQVNIASSLLLFLCSCCFHCLVFALQCTKYLCHAANNEQKTTEKPMMHLQHCWPLWSVKATGKKQTSLQPRTARKIRCEENAVAKDNGLTLTWKMYVILLFIVFYFSVMYSILSWRS